MQTAQVLAAMRICLARIRRDTDKIRLAMSLAGNDQLQGLDAVDAAYAARALRLTANEIEQMIADELKEAA